MAKTPRTKELKQDVAKGAYRDSTEEKKKEGDFLDSESPPFLTAGRPSASAHI